MQYTYILNDMSLLRDGDLKVELTEDKKNSDYLNVIIRKEIGDPQLENHRTFSIDLTTDSKSLKK